jgi:hypothetical protein
MSQLFEKIPMDGIKNIIVPVGSGRDLSQLTTPHYGINAANIVILVTKQNRI